MASRSAGRTRSKSSDSQLEFFTLAFGRVDPTPPQTEPPKEKEASSETGNEKAGQSETHKSDGIQKASAEVSTEAKPPVEITPFDEVRLPSISSASEEPKPRNENDYHITDADRLGSGSLKSKCQANLSGIALLKRLEGESRPATPDEKRILVRYTGWGGLPQVFDSANETWREERETIESLLTLDELDSARATTLNAHYTSPTVIRAMYAALSRLGFTHGRILEPACGIGHFIGLMPSEMHDRSQITAIEIDSVTARIAKQLYPDADVRHQPFEGTKLADGFYDVAISNIPFGNYRPFDARFKSWKFLIHDYFFAAALEKIRPGGFILFVTSRGTMDKPCPPARSLAGPSGIFRKIKRCEYH